MSDYKKYLKYRNIPLSGSLNRILEKEHVTQSELAARSGISRQRINDYVKGRRRISKATSQRLGEALRIDIPNFFITIQTNHDAFIAKSITIKVAKPDLTQFRPAVFWDTRFDTIDWNRNKRWIIQRIFEYGNSKEIAETIRFYGKNDTRQILAEVTSDRNKPIRDSNIRKYLK